MAPEPPRWPAPAHRLLILCDVFDVDEQHTLTVCTPRPTNETCRSVGRLRQHGRHLSQANQSAASHLLALAAHLGERAPQDWAARVLAAAQARSPSVSNEQVLRVARAVALARSLAPSTGEMRALLGSSQPATLRSDEQARADFNRPSHWGLGADGLFAPDASQMQGESARSWSSLTGKFGAELARRMFDANVRGGAMAVFAAMDAAGSPLSVTVSDIARLQFAALTNGRPLLPGVDAPALPTLHDTAHAMSGYGVSAQQEIHGDLFSEDVLDMLFGAPTQITIDLSRSLDQQPQVVHRLQEGIQRQFDALSLNLLLAEIDLAFRTRIVGGRRQTHDWGGTAQASATRAEQILEANGLLAHLTGQGREAVRAVIYGASDPMTFESLAAEHVRSGDYKAFERDVDEWLDEVARTLREVSPHALMTRDEFNRHAARAIAFGLTIERAAPGSLAMGLQGVPVEEADLLPAARALDLRRAYPAYMDSPTNASDRSS